MNGVEETVEKSDSAVTWKSTGETIVGDVDD